MKFYLVGGCVRDRLLGLNPQDRDWVVVGATEQQMCEQGFKKVGAHFPVFLHPHTKEEYALARLERKQGQGYGGFVVCADLSVSLEEDLKRRDLTINAIAFDPQTNTYIDPFGGQDDLKNRVLRHVSSAFSDDPLRLVRLARFAAIFSDMSLAPQTYELALTIVQSGELQLLPAERVTLEIEKAYQKANNIERFWDLLHDWGALTALFSQAHIPQQQWQYLIPALSDSVSLIPADYRWVRALSQVLVLPEGGAFYQKMTKSLKVSSSQQRLAKLTANWLQLTKQRQPSIPEIVAFLTQHRLFQQGDDLSLLNNLITTTENKNLLSKIQDFVKKMAQEPPKTWLEKYPPAQRRQELEKYYDAQAQKFFKK